MLVASDALSLPAGCARIRAGILSATWLGGTEGTRNGVLVANACFRRHGLKWEVV